MFPFSLFLLAFGDFSKGLEKARSVAMAEARPVDDWTHMQSNLKRPKLAESVDMVLVVLEGHCQEGSEES